MFEVAPLPSPETVTVPGGQFTLTHKTAQMVVDPRSKDGAVILREMKGFLDADGKFQDFGDPQVSQLDAKGLSDLLASTAGGKPAGVFRTDDIPKAIETRKAEIRAAADAEAKASQELKPQPKPVKP